MKSLVLPVSISVLFLLLICLPGVSRGEEAVPTQVVEAEGSAPVTGGDLARARSEAVRNALQKAVEQVALRWLTPQEAAEKSSVLKVQIPERAEGFIQEYRIVSEMTAADVHTVGVRASVLAESLRNEMLALGLLRPVQVALPVTRFSLTIRGIRSYGEYVRCRATLKDRVPGIREVIPREASWSMARFEIAADGTVPILTERLREKLAADVQRQDDRALEIRLR